MSMLPTFKEAQHHNSLKALEIVLIPIFPNELFHKSIEAASSS